MSEQNEFDPSQLYSVTMFYMTLDEALRRSPTGGAYAWAPDVVGGFIYCSKDGEIHTGAELWLGDPRSVGWRPTGGEHQWLPVDD